MKKCISRYLRCLNKLSKFQIGHFKRRNKSWKDHDKFLSDWGNILALMGPRQDLSPNLSHFNFPFLTILCDMGIFNILSTFDSQIPSYRQDTETCYVLHMCCFGITFNQIFWLIILYMNMLSSLTFMPRVIISKKCCLAKT